MAAPWQWKCLFETHPKDNTWHHLKCLRCGYLGDLLTDKNGQIISEDRDCWCERSRRTWPIDEIPCV
jgi:hypothetical protein